MKGMNSKVFITMPEMMEQMDCGDRTIHEMIDKGDLPDFCYEDIRQLKIIVFCSFTF